MNNLFTNSLTLIYNSIKMKFKQNIYHTLFYCVSLFLTSCQNDMILEPVTILKTEKESEDCNESLELTIVSRRTDNVGDKYFYNIYQENPSIQAVIYSKEYNEYIGLTLLPPKDIQTIQQDCNCSDNSFNTRNVVIPIKQPDGYKKLETRGGGPLLDLLVRGICALFK